MLFVGEGFDVSFDNKYGSKVTPEEAAGVNNRNAYIVLTMMRPLNYQRVLHYFHVKKKAVYV
jgi:hypothetical protein